MDLSSTTSLNSVSNASSRVMKSIHFYDQEWSTNLYIRKTSTLWEA